MKRLLVAIFIVATLVFVPVTAAATDTTGTGYITLEKFCLNQTLRVWLNNNVTSDMSVVVTSTIPGTPPIIVFDPIDTTSWLSSRQILAIGGSYPLAGSVTLTIDDFSTTQKVNAKKPCPNP